MRNLHTVITQLLEVIPDSEESLRLRLISAQNKLKYAAPETLSYHWSVVAWILEANTLDRSEDWIKVTQQIFNNETPQTNLPT
jgi:hypothetical protein